MTRLATTSIATIALISLLASTASGGSISTIDIDSTPQSDEEDWMLDQSDSHVDFLDEFGVMDPTVEIVETPITQGAEGFRAWSTYLSSNNNVGLTSSWAVSGQSITPHGSVGRTELIMGDLNSPSAFFPTWLQFPTIAGSDEGFDLAWNDVVTTVDSNTLHDACNGTLASLEPGLGLPDLTVPFVDADESFLPRPFPLLRIREVVQFHIPYDSDNQQTEFAALAVPAFGESLVEQALMSLQMGTDHQPTLRAANGLTSPQGSHGPEPRPHPLPLNDEAIPTTSGRELVSRILRYSFEEADGDLTSHASNSA